MLLDALLPQLVISGIVGCGQVDVGPGPTIKLLTTDERLNHVHQSGLFQQDAANEMLDASMRHPVGVFVGVANPLSCGGDK